MKAHLHLAAACAMFALASSAHAASVSSSSSAPVINDADIANYGEVTGTDKWSSGTGVEGPPRGQTFTTGGAAIRLKSFTYQLAEGGASAPTKTFIIRIGKVAGTTFTQAHSESVVQNSSTFTNSQYVTWTLDTPIILEPYTVYGIDMGITNDSGPWQNGIPYINVTANEYAGGVSYKTGTNGVGTNFLNLSINSDRIFHIDLEDPLGPVFSLVAPSPADNTTDALATREVVMTFSQTVTAGSGNLTIRNLTDNIDTLIPANDSRLTYDDNVVRLAPTGLIAWGKSYAIRMDAGVFLGTGGALIPAISDDTTWNFTTLASDPLLAAIAALKGHVNRTALLSGSVIQGHKYTIDNMRQRFAETPQIITAVFDLISTYDSVRGPLFVSNVPSTNSNNSNYAFTNATYFGRAHTDPRFTYSISDENIHWVIYTVMQHTMDWIYTAEALAQNEALLTNYKFGSHTNFPGPCPPPAPGATHNVTINGSFPATFSRLTQAWTLPARKPTGTYLSPGSIVSVVVPPALVNAGYRIRVGAHSWDLSAREPVLRLERGTRLYDIDSTTTKIASPYGGGIYIEVPYLASAGPVNITINGAVRSPYFSAKTIHQTTPAEWDIERTHTAPWADLQSEKFMCQVPRKWIYNMNGTQATQLMVDWDKGMDAINDLMGFPRNRGKETMYCQPDVALRSSVHAPGYPAVNLITNPNNEVSPLGYAGNYLVSGPGANPTSSHIEFHEQGHAFFFPKFGGENESTVNLLQPAMLNRGFGISFDTAHAASLGNGNPFITIDNTAVAWMTVFNFSPREVPMASGESAYQHKGHAKWMDIARLFGWDKLDTFWRDYMQDEQNNLPVSEETDALLLRLCRATGKDIRPLLHFWGIHPQNPATLAASIASENIPSSPEIKAQLLRYKTLVPTNNAAFRTFAQTWRSKVPSITGAWEEREHARQWDTAALYGAGDQQRGGPGIDGFPSNPGEIYNENSANDIRNRIQELVDLYYPIPIAPSAMSFGIAPSNVDSTTISMTATTATAVAGLVEYYFENITNSTNSGWITSTTWSQTGLITGTTYTYRVKARDGSGNETAWSTIASVTAGLDLTPPSPNPMGFAIAPSAPNQTSITMTAVTVTDISGVEYYFDCTAGGGNDSGWQDSPTYTDTGLPTGASFSYRVQARDKSPAQNTTSFSAAASAITTDITPPTIVSLAPANAATGILNTSDLIVTFSEPIVRGTGFITLKNLTDATRTQIDITDLVQTSITGSLLTINPTSNLIEGKTYAIQIAATAIDDISANSYSGIANDTTWSFSVADPTPPAVLTLSPADNSTTAPNNANLVITFTETVIRGAGDIILKNLTDATQAAIAITDNSQVSLVGPVLTINPTADLLVGKNYAIQLANTAISDPAANPYPGISDDTTWNFTTVTPTNTSFWLGVTGNWSAPATWVDGIIPTGIDYHTNLTNIDITADQTVTLDSARTIGNITFTDTTPSNNAAISGANTLTLDRSTGTPTIDVTQSGRTLTISSGIAGNDGFQKTGLGTLTLTGNNTYTGTTAITAGTLRLEGTSGGFFSSTSATRNYTISSGAILNLHNAGVPVGTVNLTGTGTLLISGSGLSAANSGRAMNVNLGVGSLIDIASGAGWYNGGWQAFTWTNNKATLNVNGGLDMADGKEIIADTLTGNGAFSASQSSGGNVNLTLGVNNGSGTFNGTITNTGTRVVSLVKNGSGTQTFTGTTTFRGATTVNAGTLSITGTHSTTGVTVNNSATLGGNGNITGNVSIASGARHALAVAATPAAQVTRAITGTLTLTSGNILDLTAAAPPAAGVYVLATATTAITGTPTTINSNVVNGVVTVDTASSPKRLLLTVTAPANTYASWIAGYPGAASMPGFNQDADNDGIENGIENFFGTNPTTSTTGLLPGTKTASAFTFTHPQNATPASNITATYRWSKNLATYHTSGVGDGNGTTVTFTTQLNTPTTGITTVTATVTGNATEKMFVDVKVTTP